MSRTYEVSKQFYLAGCYREGSPSAKAVSFITGQIVEVIGDNILISNGVKFQSAFIGAAIKGGFFIEQKDKRERKVQPKAEVIPTPVKKVEPVPEVKPEPVPEVKPEPVPEVKPEPVAEEAAAVSEQSAPSSEMVGSINVAAWLAEAVSDRVKKVKDLSVEECKGLIEKETSKTVRKALEIRLNS